MRHFIKSITKTSLTNPYLSRNAVQLAKLYEATMYPKPTTSLKYKYPIPNDLSYHIRSNKGVSVLPRVDRPNLTAGGWHSEPVIDQVTKQDTDISKTTEPIIMDTTDEPVKPINALTDDEIHQHISGIQYYIDKHYEIWKNEKR